MRQQQRDEIKPALCDRRHEGCAPKLRYGINISAALDEQFGRIKVLPVDCIVEWRCETIRFVDVCTRIQRRRDGRYVTFLGSVVNGRRPGCRRDQTEPYQEQQSGAH
jgi:hypothetical protein